PRGQLVATQAARLERDSEELAAVEAELLAHREALLGPHLELDPAPQIEWYLGFWRSLGIGQFGWSPHPAVLAHVAALLACDSARFLRELSVWGGVTLDVIPLVARTAPTLRSLELSLGPNVFDDASLHGLRGCTELRKLHLFSCDRVTAAGLAVGALGGLAALASLHLGHCAITDVGCAALGGLTALRFLDLSSTNVTGAGLRELARLPQLTTLDLSFLELDDDDVQALLALPNLTALGLAYSRRLTDRAIDLVCQLPALTTLDLGGASITPAGIDRLAQLPELRELGLTSCSDEVRAHAESFPHWYVDHRDCLEFDDEVY
nr:hypothetical protein [Deltaproteobacteria bacterium]